MPGYGLEEKVVCWNCGRERRREARAEIRPSRCRSCAATDRNKRRAREGHYERLTIRRAAGGQYD